MEPDGALYASIAKQIAKTNNWLYLYSGGADWLDKPHMPFWLAAISFKIAGINSFAYKLPSFICFIISLVYCYKIAASVYNTVTARLSTLIYATAIHIIISNFDGKAEIYLTTFIIAAIYHLYKAMEKKWFIDIFLAAAFSACAIMTKGIFCMITITAGFLIFWIKTKQWNEFLKPKWYLFILLTAVFIIPEIYSLYTQFDLHPEKIVFGRTNVSGVKFFYWDSQFGRFFNNGPIKGSGDLSFFVHTTLWAFLPWSLVFFIALTSLLPGKKIYPASHTGWILGGSALITFIIFSLSKFQLPHYIIILFPHFSIFTSYFLAAKISEKNLRRINAFQTFMYVFLIAAITVTIVLYRFNNIIWFAVFAILLSTGIIVYRNDNLLTAIIKKNTAFALLLAVFLNLLFYPSLFKYQAGIVAADWLNSNHYRQQAIMYQCESYSFDFYYKGGVVYTNHRPVDINQVSLNDSLLLYLPAKNLSDINTGSLSVQELHRFPHFWISKVNGRFINYKTRKDELDTLVLAIIKRKNL